MTDAVCLNRPTTPQIEAETGALAKLIADGRSIAPTVFQKDIDEMKAKDPPALHSAHEQMFMRALHCADPADVSAKIDPHDKTKMSFNVDFWKSNTNLFYEQAKGHALTPGFINLADGVINQTVGENDRDKAVAVFNERAREENQPMRIELNPQNKIELKEAPINTTASSKP